MKRLPTPPGWKTNCDSLNHSWTFTFFHIQGFFFYPDRNSDAFMYDTWLTTVSAQTDCKNMYGIKKSSTFAFPSNIKSMSEFGVWFKNCSPKCNSNPSSMDRVHDLLSKVTGQTQVMKLFAHLQTNITAFIVMVLKFIMLIAPKSHLPFEFSKWSRQTFSTYHICCVKLQSTSDSQRDQRTADINVVCCRYSHVRSAPRQTGETHFWHGSQGIYYRHDDCIVYEVQTLTVCSFIWLLSGQLKRSQSMDLALMMPFHSDY